MLRTKALLLPTLSSSSGSRALSLACLSRCDLFVEMVRVRPDRFPMLPSQRIVRLGGAVDDDMANLLVAQLLYLDSIDQKKDITMYINSPGGSVTAGGSHGVLGQAQ